MQSRSSEDAPPFRKQPDWIVPISESDGLYLVCRYQEPQFPPPRCAARPPELGAPPCGRQSSSPPPTIAKLQLMLVWGCWPVWMYDPDDGFIDNALPQDLPAYAELVTTFTALQARYNALYRNTPREFSWIGFPSQEEEDQFKSDWYAAVSWLKEAAGEKYIVVDEVDFRPEEEAGA